MGRVLCRWILGVLAGLYALALFVGLVGTYGWFGQDKDPLSWIFVIVLGQPWVALVVDVSEPLRPWLAALMPLINLALLAALCKFLSARFDNST